MQYLSRKKIYEKVEVNKDAKKVYIFCEGEEKEVHYFDYFKGLSSNIDIIPIGNDKGKSDPTKLKDHAQLLFFGNELIPPKHSLSKEYKDEIWFVIDTDRWNEGDKINFLKEFCNANNTSNKQWIVAQSNPSFEIWLYYHFYDAMPEKSMVETYASFKEFVNAVIRGGFDNRKMPIEIESAIKNAMANFNTNNGQPSLYSTEVFELGKVILPFVKEQIDKAKEMMTSANIT
jgi:hypothetical protein